MYTHTHHNGSDVINEQYILNDSTSGITQLSISQKPSGMFTVAVYGPTAEAISPVFSNIRGVEHRPLSEGFGFSSKNIDDINSLLACINAERPQNKDIIDLTAEIKAFMQQHAIMPPVREPRTNLTFSKVLRFDGNDDKDSREFDIFRTKLFEVHQLTKKPITTNWVSQLANHMAASTPTVNTTYSAGSGANESSTPSNPGLNNG